MVSRCLLPVVTLALVGCGGSVEGSSDEAGSDGSDLRDATSDALATADSPDGASLIGDASVNHDVTLPFGGSDGSDDTTLDAGPDTYDGAFFPDGLCGPSTCLRGCCTDVGECVEPPTDTQCGWAGSLCQICDAGPCADYAGCTVVLFGCGASDCSGCCIGNDSGAGGEPQAACMPGLTPEFCGAGGDSCQICGPGQTCRAIGFDAGGFCQANTVCDPTTCTGCCIDGVCAQGDQAIACGIGGTACKDCGDGGLCQEGNCSCGPPFGPPCTGDN
jgi:hypothetical protein